MKRKLRNFARKLGYDIIPYSEEKMGKNPYDDIAKFISSDSPMIFDIGANVGQTITAFRKQFPKSIINSFEPSPSTFETLTKNVQGVKNLKIWNIGIGSSSGSLVFSENVKSDMSSFLKPSESSWGKFKQDIMVDVKTIDQFCSDEKIVYIDLLKSDTQGFEYEVFKGAEKTMRENKIGLIYFEVIFSDMYKNLPSFGDMYNFLIDKGFLLVTIYPFQYQDGLAGWTDVLFVHRTYLKK